MDTQQIALSYTADGREDQITLSLQIENGELKGLTASDSEGHNYCVSLQLKLTESENGRYNICCCVDPVTLTITCQKVNGDCPGCPGSDND